MTDREKQGSGAAFTHAEAGRIYKSLEKPFVELTAADRLAYEVARLVVTRKIGARSPVADALLDYLKGGQPGGPVDVVTWMVKYREENGL